MKCVFLLLPLLLLVGCPDNDASATRLIPAPASATAAALAPTPAQQKAADLNEQLKDAEAARDKAAADGRVLDRLSAERDVLQLRVQIAEEQARQLKLNAEAYKAQIEDKDKEIKAERISEWQSRLWVAAGIIGFLAVIATVVMFAWPLLRGVAGWAAGILSGLAVALAVIGKCLPFFIWLIDLTPYILGFAALVGVGFGILALRNWWLTHHATNQFVTAIEELKPKTAAELKAFKEKLRMNIDTPIEALVDRIKKRKNIGASATPPAAGTPT